MNGNKSSPSLNGHSIIEVYRNDTNRKKAELLIPYLNKIIGYFIYRNGGFPTFLENGEQTIINNYFKLSVVSIAALVTPCKNQSDYSSEAYKYPLIIIKATNDNEQILYTGISVTDTLEIVPVKSIQSEEDTLQFQAQVEGISYTTDIVPNTTLDLTYSVEEQIYRFMEINEGREIPHLLRIAASLEDIAKQLPEIEYL